MTSGPAKLRLPDKHTQHAHVPANAEASVRARERAVEIVRILSEEYPDARCMLDYGNVPYRLLLSTIMSAQTTDEAVNRVSPALWEAYPDLESLARAPRPDVERIIHSLGFFRAKSASIQGAAAWLLENTGGRVPEDFDDLLRIPGVGRKTANVVRAELHGLPALIVDTHVKRLSFRLGLTSSDDPARIETDLEKLVPSASRTVFSHSIGFHGRRVCTARKPSCGSCSLASLCPKKGLA